jgi:broad specificity phosphatase PhoE
MSAAHVNRLYLVRHGENQANLTKEFSYRRVDYSLTPKGVLQAQQTAEYFTAQPVDAIYSSPLKRAVETAQIIAAHLGLSCQVVEDFREVNVGDLEGQPVTPELWERHNRIIYAWFNGDKEARFPGGEDYHALWARTQAGLRLALAGLSDRTALIVGHGGMFTLTLRDLCPAVDGAWLRHQVSQNCSISEVLLQPQNGAWHGELVRWNDARHLHGAAAELVSGLPDEKTFRN